VAKELLGCFLVKKTQTGGGILKGKIVETEAYLGLKDESCHSFGGKKTKRTKIMYHRGGVAYVYFTYGMHHCFNIVTAKKGEPEAVLIRALEPITGIEEMFKNRFLKNQNRKTPITIKNLTNGPGKLCQALNICKKLNGEDLRGNKLYIEKGIKIAKKNIGISRRIGLSTKQSSYYWPLRFYIKDSAFLSIKSVK